jgi:hypothetical protein
MRPPFGEQGRSGFRIAVDRSKEFWACLQLRALPAGLGGAFNNDGPPSRLRFDGIQVSGKPQLFQEGPHGSRGPGQIGFGSVCHASVAGPVSAQDRVPAAMRNIHERSPQGMGEKFIIVPGSACRFPEAAQKINMEIRIGFHAPLQANATIIGFD